MSDFQNKSVAVYRKLSKIPSLDSVVVSDDPKDISGNVLHWQAKWSHRDISRNEKITYTSSGSISSNEGQLTSIKSPYTSEISNEKMMTVSRTNLRAILKEIEIKNEKHNFLEIWDGSHKISNTNLSKEDKHGIIHTNSVFGCLNWSNGSDKIVYVAEKKFPKSRSFFDKTENANEGENEVGQEFVYKEDWGEQLVGSYHPTLFIYDINTRDDTDVSSYLSVDGSVGCALWSKDDKFLYILSWNGSPWKVGLIYCKNRYSTLYKLDLESKELTSLTDGKSCAFSTMLSPDGSKLIYLESVPLGQHRQCVKLLSVDLNSKSSSKKSSLIVDIVKCSDDADSFQGLYIDKMRDNCWLSNGHELIVSSLHRSNLALLCIDITTGKVTLLESEGTWTILRVKNDVLFVSYSSPNTPAIFKAGHFNRRKIEWIDIDAPVSEIEQINWAILRHEPVMKNEDYPGLDYESVLIKPSSDIPFIGLIVNPHGGPHSCFVAGFDVFTAAFCQLGFAVLRINYRGSIGFGQNNVCSLPKNIGRQDVSDVQHAVETVTKDLCISSGRVFVYGGSHGGFLTLHLVGQYPDFYSAAATRNPVTNVVSQTATTDIVDWSYLEGGGKFSYGCVATHEVFLKHLECSPIVHVSSVKTPLLFMLGLADKRVPPSQSFEYIHALQGLEKKVMVLSYNDNNHSLAKVDAEADCFLNMVKWFSTHKS